VVQKVIDTFSELDIQANDEELEDLKDHPDEPTQLMVQIGTSKVNTPTGPVT